MPKPRLLTWPLDAVTLFLAKIKGISLYWSNQLQGQMPTESFCYGRLFSRAWSFPENKGTSIRCTSARGFTQKQGNLNYKASLSLILDICDLDSSIKLNDLENTHITMAFVLCRSSIKLNDLENARIAVVVVVSTRQFGQIERSGNTHTHTHTHTAE